MLLDDEYKLGERVGAWSNETFLQHRFNLGFNFMFLKMRVKIWVNIYRLRVGKKMNMVIGRSRGR